MISSFSAHLSTVSEKECEADFRKHHAYYQLEGRDIYRYIWYGEFW